MSLTDQDRIEMAADNCEVLRARLAKYEDAEGRALQPAAADLVKRIDKAITDFTSGRACMHVPPRDTDVDIVLSECLKLANALESQAREIERLKSWKSEEMEVMTPLLDYARSACTGPLGCSIAEWLVSDHKRLAALKAQPSGVVLPRDPEKSFLEWASDCPLPPTQLDAYRAGVSEVSRLNSSLVSAGDDLTASECSCGDQYPANSYGAGFMAANNGVCENCDAGNSCGRAGVDERSAFEVEIPAIAATFDGLYLTPVIPLKAGEHLMTVAQHLRIEKQIRAALSAPSHGEQVREAVPDEMRSLAQRLREYNLNPHHINPMSEAFHVLVAEAANALSAACAPKEIIAAITWADHLLFECGALTRTRAPSVHVYNKTFEAVNAAKAMLAAAPTLASGVPSVSRLDYDLLKLAMQDVKDQLASCEQALADAYAAPSAGSQVQGE